MSESSLKRSAEFLKVADQFRLGELVTESSHPVTAKLSETARRDIAAALGQLFEVDDDVVRKYREVAADGRLGAMADTVSRALRAGGKIFFTGCGSTGRLSIQLVSIWRDFWQQRGQADWENRAFAVMAGGDYALIKAVEGFEDFTAFGKKQLADLGVASGDVVFAITEGGETSFVIGTAWQGVEAGAKVYFVYNNPDDILCEHVQRSREVIQDARIEKLNLTTGPMAITGSTRMQATSIQLAVLATVLEMVARQLTGHEEVDAVPAQFAAQLAAVQAVLKSAELRSQLARLVALEESAYRAGRKNNYFADRVGIDMLTDTTERSPTYCTPPFRKFDDTTATESWAFLYVPYPDSPTAWERICKRVPRCVDWPAEAVRGLVPEDKLARTEEIIGKIGYGELMRFRIGLDGLPNRPLGAGDSAVALVTEAEKEAVLAPDGFQRTQLEAAHKAGARTGLIFVGSAAAGREVGEFAAGWNPDCVMVRLAVPTTDFLLDGVMRVGLKLLLNALSTCTMVRLGRVMGNTMIWVVPSNLKLIDRATRYIARLAKLDYVAANQLLFEVIEYVEPRMKADQAYPPVVGVSVLRARQGLGNEEAERRLMAELAGEGV
ncbi:MAG TPA: hypothetical protein VFV96_17585 [Verrucomicrobiae bacterium]|nr:hypothetical protein [Verrucomicrobiae bacterium]